MSFEPIKAKLVCLEVSGLELEFPYNPKEFSLTRNSGFSAKDKGGGPWGGIKADCAKPDELKFDFVLDCSEPEDSLAMAALMLPISSLASLAGMADTTSVLKDVMTLHDMTIQRNVDAEGNYKRPPFCAFLWGDFQFFGGIVTVDTKAVLFDFRGIPKRAEVNISMLGQAFQAPKDASELTGTSTTYSYKSLGKKLTVPTDMSMDPRLALFGKASAKKLSSK
ncbi:MAG: hypothetical protein ACI8S6_002120 [Myxococcota bacterium]|jgi:hypothetical protein